MSVVDPTSDLGENVDEEDAPECSTCGAPVHDSPDHRVVTWVEDDRVRTAHFCDEECRDDWERD